MAILTLITGGIRSGKSRYALDRARRFTGAKKCFIATAEALDEEMKLRIARHREERGSDFFTLEEPRDLTGALREAECRHDVVLIDCLNFWISNLLLHFPDTPEQIETEIKSFLQAVRIHKKDIFLVTNEVGLGLVPDHALARRFVDLLGGLNQALARFADEVILMVAGIPQSLKERTHAGLEI